MAKMTKQDWIAKLAARTNVPLVVAELLLSDAQEDLESSCDDEYELNTLKDADVFEFAADRYTLH